MSGHCLDCDVDVEVMVALLPDGYLITDGVSWEDAQHLGHDIELEQ